MSNQPAVLCGPSDRVLRRVMSMQYRRRLAEAFVVPQEHTIGAAWQPQLSTGILGALVPSCPDGVGVLSFGLDSAMRQRGLRRCTHRLRQATTIRTAPLGHAVPTNPEPPSWMLSGHVSATR